MYHKKGLCHSLVVLRQGFFDMDAAGNPVVVDNYGWRSRNLYTPREEAHVGDWLNTVKVLYPRTVFGKHTRAAKGICQGTMFLFHCTSLSDFKNVRFKNESDFFMAAGYKVR